MMDHAKYDILEDRYHPGSDRLLASGVQMLVRLPLEQSWADKGAGLNTAGFISGYRGSPLATYDRELWRAGKRLSAEGIVFKPAINEDLGVTAVWGAQQAELNGEGRHEGVFALWYGKGPGVDRSGDALRHGNLSGSSPKGGVLLLLGDDHTSESSSTAHQSEYAMMDYSIPVFSPASVAEFLEFGLYGIALSRFAGVFAALKCVHDLVESTESVELAQARPKIVLPSFEMPQGGLNIRLGDTPLEQERRLHLHKLPAVAAFLSANPINRTIISATHRRLAIISSGKAYRDTIHALRRLGLDDEAAAEKGISLFKVGMPYPLESDALREFCSGHESVLVIEEKRPLIEDQLRKVLYGLTPQPRIIGKTDEAGASLLPTHGILTPHLIAQAIAARLGLPYSDPRPRKDHSFAVRKPHFCAGCPHSTSTNVPDGSRAMAGTGCSYMVQWMDRRTHGYTHMGADGVTWIGEAPFSTRNHIFQNMGDGTYQHSGVLAIRASVAAESNITYKILYNDAVAMTGGQPHDGPLPVDAVARQVIAEGASRVMLASDEPEKYRPGEIPATVEIIHRDGLDAAQRSLRDTRGVSVLIYDQTCAAEKRRRRKRGTFPDPAKRVFINELVCEGCGDCGVASNCVAVLPKETEFGRKRAIDQTACNKDFSCVKGFCPSFVTVEGGQLKRVKAGAPDLAGLTRDLPDPILPERDGPTGVVIAGIGGTGVLTVSALLGAAAHLQGLGCSILDMTGLAQKGGAVASYVWIGGREQLSFSPRINTGECNSLIACDLMVAAGELCLPTLAPALSGAVLNTHETLPGAFTRDPDFRIDTRRLEATIRRNTDPARTHALDATRLTEGVFGSTETANVLMLGAAYQQGLIPLNEAAIIQAIRINGVAVEQNLAAFRLGRAAICRSDEIRAALEPSATPYTETLDELIRRRAQFLTAYQDQAYADRYLRLVERMSAAERKITGEPGALTEAAARSYFKLLAYKDEYEVARLHADSGVTEAIKAKFDGPVRIKFHLAPPLFAKKDPVTGHARKSEYGGYALHLFRLLARFRFLRGTVFDPFGHSSDRKLERKLIGEFENWVEHVLARLDATRLASAIELLSLAQSIRGYGHVKERNAEIAADRARRLLEALGT